MPRTRFSCAPKALTAISCLALLAACDPNQMDPDFRSYGKGFDTTDAAMSSSLRRPTPDANGVISYPTYQVALARNGETVAQVAQRLGVDANELARYNGLNAADPLRRDELLALPTMVNGGAVASSDFGPVGGVETTTLQPSNTDITSIAEIAIDRSPQSSTITPAPQAATSVDGQPVRHKVQRGETAFIIARLYNVPVRSLAEWNGLDSNFTVREGQVLLIPVTQAQAAAPAPAPKVVKDPGAGSATPTPPSATKPLPKETPKAAAEPVKTPEPPKVTQSAKPAGRLGWPVQGNIVRDYKKGANDGIDIASTSGAAVQAAEAGTVAAITADANQVPILVIKHPNNLLTVYAYIDDLAVKKGDSVTRGQTIAKVRAGSPAILHFEVRDGFESVDPTGYLNK